MNYRIIQVVIAVLAIANPSAQLSAEVVVSQEPIQDTELIIDTKGWKFTGADFTKYDMCPVRVTITNTGSEQATYQLGPDALSVDAVFARLSYRELKRVLASFFINYFFVSLVGAGFFIFYFQQSTILDEKIRPLIDSREYFQAFETIDVVIRDYININPQMTKIAYITLIASPSLYWWYIHNTNNKLRMALDEIIIREVFVLEPGQSVTGIIVNSEKVLPAQQNNALE